MGYRSDVAALFYAEAEKDMPVIKLWLDENFPMDTFSHAVRWFDRGMAFYEDNVKWYDSYPEIQAFDEARDKFIAMFCQGVEGAVKGAFEFLRVGENYDDVESDYVGECDYLLDLKREIKMPWP